MFLKDYEYFIQKNIGFQVIYEYIKECIHRKEVDNIQSIILKYNFSNDINLFSSEDKLEIIEQLNLIERSLYEAKEREDY